MDLDQTDHLKAYGITFWAQKGLAVDWLLNYRGGSFMADYSDLLAAECRIRGVSFEEIDATAANSDLYNGAITGSEYGCRKVGKSAEDCGLYSAGLSARGTMP